MFPIEGLLGGLTGLISGAVTGIMNLKVKKLELEQKKIDNLFIIERISAESKAMIQEKDAEIKVISTEYEGREALADAEIYAEGQKNQKQAEVWHAAETYSDFIAFYL